MNIFTHFIESLARFANSRDFRGLRWCMVILIVVAAGPLGFDVVFLVDLVTMVGVDVLVLSMLYYFANSMGESWRAFVSLFAGLFARNGDVILSRQGLTSRADTLRLLEHNFIALLTPTRFVALAVLCACAGPALYLLSASHVA